MSNRVTIVSADEAFEQTVRACLGQPPNGQLRRLASLPEDPDAVLAVLAGPRGGTTEVVALGPGMNAEVALELARRFDAERPEISVVLVAPPSPTLLQQALEAGVRGVLAPNAKAAEVRATFERAMTSARQRRASVGAGASPSVPARHLITVLSPKGGSGKTTVAVNLAVALAQRAPHEVVLVDLDLQFGDAASALQLRPEASAADVARRGDFGAAAVKVALTEHDSGLYVLCASELPVDAEDITAEAVGSILDVLAQEFRYVVVDTNAGLSEHTLTAIERSTDLVLLCSMDVPSIRALHKELSALDQLGMTAQRRTLVLNRADSRVGLAIEDVEALLGMDAAVQIPSARAVPQSTNEGIPLVQSDPRSGVGRQLLHLADLFLELPAPRAGGLLRRMKGVR